MYKGSVFGEVSWINFIKDQVSIRDQRVKITYNGDFCKENHWQSTSVHQMELGYQNWQRMSSKHFKLTWQTQSTRFLTSIFGRFLQFSQNLYIKQKLTIPHFKALITRISNLERERHGIIRNRSASLKRICHTTSKYLLDILCQFWFSSY